MNRSMAGRPARPLPFSARRMLALALTFGTAACSDNGPSGPAGVSGGDLLLVTTIANPSGTEGSSFIQTVDLARSQVSNADAHEQTFIPYASIRGDDVIVTQHLAGDQAVRYVRGSDGRLNEAGRLNLPAGGVGANVLFVGPTRAYVSVSEAGRIIEFDPQTMTQTGEIDLTGLGLARDPSNPDGRNPNPSVMLERGGRLYVALQQLVGLGFASADGVDVAIFDAATGELESVAHDPRASSPGRMGYNDTMFVDEHGDLYVMCVASWGFAPGQKAGILRIRSGETTFDPDYFVNLTDAPVDVAGGRIGFLNSARFGHDGHVYGIAEVPGLLSNPPQYGTDRAYQPVRVDLASGQVEVLPFPPSSGLAAGGVTLLDGLVVFGLSTSNGAGLYTYDPVTGQASGEPVVATQGDPTLVLAFE